MVKQNVINTERKGIRLINRSFLILALKFLVYIEKTRYTANNRPQIIKVQSAPCHKPQTKNVIVIEIV
jgi:hypothetical protein